MPEVDIFFISKESVREALDNYIVKGAKHELHDVKEHYEGLLSAYPHSEEVKEALKSLGELAKVLNAMELYAAHKLYVDKNEDVNFSPLMLERGAKTNLKLKPLNILDAVASSVLATDSYINDEMTDLSQQGAKDREDEMNGGLKYKNLTLFANPAKPVAVGNINYLDKETFDRTIERTREALENCPSEFNPQQALTNLAEQFSFKMEISIHKERLRGNYLN